MTQTYLKRPIRPGTIAVRRINGGWMAVTTTPLRRWPQLEPGLYYNQMINYNRRTLPLTVDLALRQARRHRAQLLSAAQVAASASALAETCS